MSRAKPRIFCPGCQFSARTAFAVSVHFGRMHGPRITPSPAEDRPPNPAKLGRNHQVVLHTNRLKKR